MQSFMFKDGETEYFVKVAPDHAEKLKKLGGESAGEQSSECDYTGFILNRGKKDQFTACVPTAHMQDFAQKAG